MRTVVLDFLIPQPADWVYEVISDFPSYEIYADAVKKVEIYNVESNTCESFWEVKFRDGLLRWHEQDTFFPHERRIAFRQTQGDLAVFEGSWQAHVRTDNETVLTFSARLDLGLPQLEKLLEPIAEQTLRENITSIVNGLFAARVKPHQLNETGVTYELSAV
jgi:ribosome-associated toxin RatA of RatAB toxin-antitoxin module